MFVRSFIAATMLVGGVIAASDTNASKQLFHKAMASIAAFRDTKHTSQTLQVSNEIANGTSFGTDASPVQAGKSWSSQEIKVALTGCETAIKSRYDFGSGYVRLYEIWIDNPSDETEMLFSLRTGTKFHIPDSYTNLTEVAFRYHSPDDPNQARKISEGQSVLICDIAKNGSVSDVYDRSKGELSRADAARRVPEKQSPLVQFHYDALSYFVRRQSNPQCITAISEVIEYAERRGISAYQLVKGQLYSSYAPACLEIYRRTQPADE